MRPDDDHRRGDHAVVAERGHQRDEQRVEAEGLDREAHRGAEQREQHHHRGDEQPALVPQPVREAPTATSRLWVAKRDRDERADRHDEDDDADLAEHPAERLGVDELGLGVEQPVDAVDRGQDRAAGPCPRTTAARAPARRCRGWASRPHRSDSGRRG